MSRTLLVITRHTPLPWEDGAGAYLFDLLDYLSTRGFRVTVVWTRPHDHLRWRGFWIPPRDFTRIAQLRAPGAWPIGRGLLFPAVYWKPFEARAKHRVKTALRRLGLFSANSRTTTGATPRPAPAQSDSNVAWMSPADVEERAFAARTIAAAHPDVVLANYAWMLSAIPASYRGLRACLHSDVAWKRAALSAPADGAPAITAEVEGALLSPADVIGAISAVDAAELGRLAPRARVILAPKSVSPAPLPPCPAGSTRVLCVGSDKAFNLEGVTWFLASVWPTVLRRVAAARLDLCGSIARGLPRPLPAGVDDHGSVPDLAPFYREAAVVVVPLLRATGLNIKLVEAAGLGRAVVATGTTLEGAPFLRDAVEAAETAEAFADSVARLLLDPAARDALAARARAAVAKALSPESCYGPLAAALGGGR